MAGSQRKKSAVKKTALITGASAGFGTYLAFAFAHAGFNVVIHGRDEKKLLAVADQISKKENVRCATIAADLLTAKGLDAVLAALHAQNVDVLVNNAGINPETHRRGTPSDIKDISDVLFTNTAAPIALCFGAFADFASRGGGAIINIISSAALIGSHHEPVYAASKSGLRGFSESVKAAWLKQGVRMTDIYPDALATGFASKRPNFSDLTDPRELADLVVGLCDTNSFFVRELAVQRTKNTS